jgi:ABC-type tungstate transport system permease subunit
MAATLERADREGAFTLCDRATFVARRDGLALAILYQGDDALDNEYSVLEREDTTLSTFLRSEAGRRLIGEHGVREHGEALFSPSPETP